MMLAKAVANKCNANFINIKVYLQFGESVANIFNKAHAATPCCHIACIELISYKHGNPSVDGEMKKGR